MMTSGNVPSSVNLALVTPCHKRGRKDDPNNFRPIAVTHPLMRLYAGLLNTRLLEYTEEHGLRGPSQAGFRPGHSVVHQIFSLQHMVDKRMQAGRCLYICFLDLKSARMNGGSGSRLGAGASPLTLPLTPAAMQRFLRFRTGCHGLPENVGSQSGVPRHQRVCQLCGFGDEMHLVFECAGMADLRGQFPDIFQPRQTMQQFMWQPNLLQIAIFLDAGMKRLQTVDPNEGSNI